MNIEISEKNNQISKNNRKKNIPSTFSEKSNYSQTLIMRKSDILAGKIAKNNYNFDTVLG